MKCWMQKDSPTKIHLVNFFGRGWREGRRIEVLKEGEDAAGLVGHDLFPADDPAGGAVGDDRVDHGRVPGQPAASNLTARPQAEVGQLYYLKSENESLA